MIHLLGLTYTAVVLGLAMYGAFGLLTLWLYYRHREDSLPEPAPAQEQDLPLVTIQLPVYNEPLVIERLIDAAAALDYPPHLLQIQVLDDSDDGTTALAAARVAAHQAAGLRISHLCRTNRDGYKAGALQVGLDQARGEFIAVFDADFLPQPNFLRQTIPHLLADPSLGMVQTRWGHLNAEFSALTRAQAISLDKHFAIEQLIRHRADLFPKFNGSGGIWRADCIRQAGGWVADTVCEDLDLSTRAQLDGWRFLFLPQVVSPAELPPQMTAFKSQQARWAKGSLQCVFKFWQPILRSRLHTPLARFYALISMTGYLAHPLMLGLLLLLPPLLGMDYEFPGWMLVLSVAGSAQPLLFLLSQKALYPDWRRRTSTGGAALALVAVGLAPSNTWSLLEAIFKRHHPFHRTVKLDILPQRDGGWSQPRFSALPRTPFSPMIVAELGLAAYALLGVAISLAHGAYGSVPFLLLCTAGFGYTAIVSLREMLITP